MLISFDINQDNIYDELKNNILRSEKNTNVIYGCVLVEYKNIKYILTSFQNLEGFFLSKNKKKFFLLNNKNTTEHFICNPISFHDIGFNSYEEYDCYYDNHTNLLLIKYDNDKMIYYNLSNLNIKDEIKNFTSQNIKITWTSQKLNKINISYKLHEQSYYWDDRFLFLPPKPYIIVKNNKKILPIVASEVISNDNLIGLVSIINNSEIFITPLISIIRFLNYLNNKSMVIFPIEIIPTLINFKNESVNTVCITNNYFNKKNNYINRLKKNSISNSNEFLYKNLIKKTIIYSIDNLNFDNNGNIIYNKFIKTPMNLLINEPINKIIKLLSNLINEREKSNNIIIPLHSYIWLFKDINSSITIEVYNNHLFKVNLNTEEEKNIIFSSEKNKQSKRLSLIYTLEKIKDNLVINISDLNYIKYNKKILLEVNEIFLNIFKSILVENEEYNSICEYINDNKFTTSNSAKILLLIDYEQMILSSNGTTIPTIKILSKNIDEFMIKYYNKNIKIKNLFQVENIFKNKIKNFMNLL